MAALARSIRPAMRLLASSRPVVTTQRGYADEMSFTFAAANQVRLLHYHFLLDLKPKSVLFTLNYTSFISSYRFTMLAQTSSRLMFPLSAVALVFCPTMFPPLQS